ncbi:predicted protein [Verticillium alfalfae VaMs.102]|uniref:Predicted protein n=1 Tax=Verticillium alfalfae (strain VaMs.102 / ATCC MYA-4576 / FGSC 10136) TaxID=526221 RepID=C9SDL3_VERA1|nr:predicted protein [Verticillium alfalfae VaMs.102]EEY16434.1 predicted protein [Verticillium alfalfae VaMs.102]
MRADHVTAPGLCIDHLVGDVAREREAARIIERNLWEQRLRDEEKTRYIERKRREMYARQAVERHALERGRDFRGTIDEYWESLARMNQRHRRECREFTLRWERKFACGDMDQYLNQAIGSRMNPARRPHERSNSDESSEIRSDPSSETLWDHD